MLTQIHIRNFAIIDEVELDLSSAMTVLTGETGAGKSILVDALGMVLGDRADADSVRHGQKRAEISAGFDISTQTHIKTWLEDNALDHDNECILRRVIMSEGRSKGFINGTPAPLQLMKELGEKLVDIHGQHQHQSLLKADVQREQLDAYAGNHTLAASVQDLHRQWKTASEKLTQLRAAASERDQRLDLLRFQTEDLNALALKEGELEQLHSEHKRLANSTTLIETCSNALQTLFDADDSNIQQQLNRQISALAQQSHNDKTLGNVSTMLSDAAIQIEEAGTELRHYIDSLELDPARLEWIEQRLSAIHDMARKHRIEPEELPALITRIDDELAQLEHADTDIAQLTTDVDALESNYLTKAKKLTSARKKAAKALSQKVSHEIQQLGMPNGQFVVTLKARPDGEFHASGLETIIFEVSSNPGQPPRALGKVASGGELSRISLAIQVLLADGQQIPTLIFDEVDTGIGGAVAETVGRLLRALGNSHQVLCVTHLPQVAALGHHHIQVRKQSDKKSTSTQLELLDKQRRQEEIARMLGGMEITDQTRAHAEEMIDRAGALA